MKKGKLCVLQTGLPVQLLASDRLPMPFSPAVPARQGRAHWIVRMNRRNRGGSFALMAVAMGSHLHTIGAPAGAWAALVLNFLLYPQLAYWRASRAADQRRAELQNMDFDFVLAGIWVAALGFPLWITFALCSAGSMSLVVFHGARGGLRLLAALAAGISIGVAAAGLHWRPETDLLTSVLCMVALEMYLFTFARDGYNRAMAQYKANAQLHEQYEQIQSLQTQLREQTLRDPLTGLFNRRHLDTVLAATLQRCRGGAAPLALVVIDIDHFKSINDTQGHGTGDLVLQALARLLLRHVHGEDLPFRLGGEEFLLVMPGASLDVAAERAQVLRHAFETLRVRSSTGAELSATLSCGVACFPQHADEPQALLACADQALYTAKEQGRNRVVAHGHMPPLAAALALTAP